VMREVLMASVLVNSLVHLEMMEFCKMRAATARTGRLILHILLLR
jgi:hypothetical protein